MDIVVAILVALMAAGISYATLNKSVCSKIRVLRPMKSEDNYESCNLSESSIIVMVLVVAVSGFAVAYRVMQLVSNVIGVCKMLVAFLCMTGAACVDLREKRIPNIFPLVMVLTGMVLLALGVILKEDGAIAYVTSNFLTAVVCVAILVLASFLTKQGIGAGDIKLIGALAIICGVISVIGTVMYGVFSCGVVAIVMLITKKMSTKNSLPFGPFLYIGFLVTVLTGNF